jgi:uncharacterized protein
MGSFLLLCALAGHAFVWIGLVNRLHALGIRRPIMSLLTAAMFVSAAAIPLVIGVYCCQAGRQSLTVGWRLSSFRGGGLPATVAGYVVICWIAAGMTLVRRIWFLHLHRVPACVRFRGRRQIAIAAAGPSDGDAGAHHFLVRLPMNETLRLEVSDWSIDIERLPAALDRLSIVHMADFHFTGLVGKTFFREVVQTSNELRPDLVALTGDLVDAAACIDWIPETLGRLTARCGVFFVLGNHDLRTHDVGRLRRTLVACGLVDLGNRTREIEIDGCRILLSGDEGPWIRGDVSSTRPEADDPMVADNVIGLPRPLHIALSHTPDRLARARREGADLMLAGHTHGGQIRIPPLGAIFSPSLWGVKHVSGVYHRPPTVLHVTRGVSAETPVRWLCPPEIARITLRQPPAVREE